MNEVMLLLFGAGGTGALAGLYQIINSLRTGKLQKEETLIERLDKNNRRQSERADAAETRADEVQAEAARYRVQRRRAQDQAARFRRMLISMGAESEKLEDLEEYDD
jgi:hypothetical protein